MSNECQYCLGYSNQLEQSAQKIAELEKELIDLKVKMAGVCGATVGSIVSDYKSQLANSIPIEDVEPLIKTLKEIYECERMFPDTHYSIILNEALTEFKAKHGGGN